MKILSKDINAVGYYLDKDDYIRNIKILNENYIVYKKTSCLDEYESEYWKFIERWIIETKAKKNISDLLSRIESLSDGIDTLSDYYNLCHIIKTLSNYDFNNKTFINFIRHFPALNHYIDNSNYKISAEQSSIRFHIWKNDVNLVMNFKDNYLIDFFSYDNDQDCINDKLIYSLKGELSSSSNLKKSHKISRLLSIILENHKDKSRNYAVHHHQSLNDSIKLDPVNERKLKINKSLFLYE
jgi:hypothetical protein